MFRLFLHDSLSLMGHKIYCHNVFGCPICPLMKEIYTSFLSIKAVLNFFHLISPEIEIVE